MLYHLAKLRLHAESLSSQIALADLRTQVYVGKAPGDYLV